MARAEGGFQGETGGGAAEALAASHRHWAAVYFAARGSHVAFIEGHHFVVELRK